MTGSVANDGNEFNKPPRQVFGVPGANVHRATGRPAQKQAMLPLSKSRKVFKMVTHLEIEPAQ
eukprot:scaffold39327_cov28-Cyclotella_meneghiniana.AAC.1